MAERGKGLFKAAWDGLVDFAIAHSLAIVSTAAAALMVYLASISKWLTTYGPVAWGSVGIATFLLLAGGSWVVAQGQSIFAHTQFVKRREDSSAINPLDDHFTRLRINLAEVFP